MQDNVHRIITHEFPRYFALVSRPKVTFLLKSIFFNKITKVEYGMVGPNGGELTVKAIDREAVATFPVQALVKKIKVALQTLPIDDDMVSRVTDGKLKAGPVLTVEPRRRKFHKLITLTLPSPAQDEGAQGLRLLYSLTEGNDKAEWEDLTDSVDFQVTQNGSISFMTNVSARFWVVQIFEHETVPLVERLATSGRGFS